MPTISAEEVRYLLLQKYYAFCQYMPFYRSYLRCKPEQKAIVWQYIDLLPDELPIFIGWIYEDNWSFLTTHRFFNFKNELRETLISEILKVDFDIPIFPVDDVIREFILTMPEHKIWVIDVPNSTPFEMIGFWNLLYTARKIAQTYIIDRQFKERTKEEKLEIWKIQV
jgi:hypothetical protein